MDQLPPTLHREPSAHIRGCLDQSFGLEVGQGLRVVYSALVHSTLVIAVCHVPLYRV